VTIDRAPGSALEAMVDGFAERWNKVSTQEQADQLVSEMARAAETLAAEEILAYAMRPAFRDLLLHVCVVGRARERFGMRFCGALGEDAG
jgi:hypothetical protein